MTSSSRWHVVHPSAYAHEQEALELLARHLPEAPPFRAWSNFEFIAEDGSINEVDALVVSTDRIYLIEIKHWAGRIGGNQNTWAVRSPAGRERFEENPLLLANRKARKLKSLLARQRAFQRNPGQIPFIQAAVFLSAPSCELALDEVAAQHVYLRPDTRRAGDTSIVDLIQGRTTESEGRAHISRDTERALSRAMTELGLRKRTQAATVGDFRLLRLITENDQYQDWAATHQRDEKDFKRIRIFPFARQAGASEKRARKDLAMREYQLLRGIHHEGILTPRHLTESDAGPALVYDFDPDAERLDHLLEAGSNTPTMDERLALVRQLAETLAYAHKRGVHHRALSPWTIELHGEPGRRRCVLRDWQSGIAGQDTTPETRMTVHLGQRAGVIDNPRSEVYAAPEVISGHGYDAIAIDIFSLGALTYALMSGQHPARDKEEMLAKCQRTAGLLMSEAMDGTPESLQMLVQVATDPHPDSRLRDVREFLAMLDTVEDELTAPEPVRGANPADARPGDRLTGGFTVLRRLGAGSTCHALTVEDADQRRGVLKVAREPSLNPRLEEEAATLAMLHHPNIVKSFGVYEIDGLAAIFIEDAGEQTLGQHLREHGQLSLDMLQRFGDELLGVLVYLEREGINHRDIKPENIGFGHTRTRARTLKLFDFSLARAPASNIRAGTVPYLDPFLSLGRPPRWDLHAERFAAAMTLHEMATGTLPGWGEGGQDPATTDDEARLDVEKIDASIRDGLAAFFHRALHRDRRQRFDNADDMHLAWKNLFRHIDQTTLDDDTDDGRSLDLSGIPSISPDTPLATLGLSARVLNAADRLGATTVAQLLALHGMRFHRNRGIGYQITRQLRELRDVLAARLKHAPPAETPDDSLGHWSIDRLVTALQATRLDEAGGDILNHWLGLAGEPPARLNLPSQQDAAEATGNTRQAVQDAIDTAAGRWARNSWMTELRDDVHAFLARREHIVTLAELAAHLLVRHGSIAHGDERQRLAVAVVQAVLEVEASRERARFVLFRGDQITLVIATRDSTEGAAASPAERAEYARALASAARSLAAEDPLPSPGRVQETLQAITPPAGDAPLSPERRLRLAVAAAPGVALSGRLELYPVGMPAERALRLGANSLLGSRRLSVAQLHERIHSRFPAAERLPNRPELDHLLGAIDFPLSWQEADGEQPAGFAIAAHGSHHATSTLRRHTTAVHGAGDTSPEAEQARRFDHTVRRALEGGRVLLVSAPLAWVEEAAAELVHQFGLHPLSLDRLLIDALKAEARAVGADWQVVLAADAAPEGSTDRARLAALVARAMPQVEKALLSESRPALIKHLGLLVRHGQTALIQALRDAARSGAAPARLLLVPGDSHQAPMLDGVVLPVITPADWAHLPRAWLANQHRAAPAAPLSGTPA